MYCSYGYELEVKSLAIGLENGVCVLHLLVGRKGAHGTWKKEVPQSI